VPAALRRVAVLLHCRPDEPFGIALVEAMALGLPVVAPRSAGPTEIVEDGVTGFLYPPGQAEPAARCIVRLLSDAELADRMGRAARRAAERRFASEDYVASIERMLAGLE
jgi:glycosyltransferase involved in cell wall biosynthesis